MTASPSRPDRRWIAWAVAVGCVAALIRLLFYDDGFWIDEVQSVDTADRPMGALLTQTGLADVHPPLYYLTLKLWRILFGESDAAARGLSILFGAGTVSLFVAWARAELTPAALSVATLLILVSTFHAHYSVEVRSYAMLTFLAVALAWAISRWVARPPDQAGRALAGVLAIEIALALTHYYGLLVILAVQPYIFAQSGLSASRVRRWAAGQAVVLGAIAWWIPLLLVQRLDLPAGFTAHLAEGPNVTDLFAAWGPASALEPHLVAVVAGVLVVGIAAWGAFIREAETPLEASNGTSARRMMALAALLLVIGPILALGLLPLSETTFDVVANRVLPTYVAEVAVVLTLLGAVWAHQHLRMRLRLPLALWIVVVPLVVVGVMQLFKPTLSIRNLLFTLPFVAALFGRRVNTWPRWAAVAVGAVILGLAVPSQLAMPEGFSPRADYRGVSAQIREMHPKAEPPIAVLSRFDVGALAHYSGDCSLNGTYRFRCACAHDGRCGRRIVGVSDLQAVTTRGRPPFLLLLTREAATAAEATAAAVSEAFPKAHVRRHAFRGLVLIDVAR